MPISGGEAELRERGSRFRAVVRPVASEEEARAIVEEFRKEGATHVCWAWRIGHPARERSSDAGEPAGTAGAPMLRVLSGQGTGRGISDVLAIVVRWFGGTKLGKGGLARAYAGVVAAALDGVATKERRPVVRREVELPYELHGSLQRLIHPPGVVVIEESYGERIRFVLEIEERRLAEVEEWLAAVGLEARSLPAAE